MQLQLIKPVESQKDSWGQFLYGIFKTQLSRKDKEAQETRQMGNEGRRFGT